MKTHTPRSDLGRWSILCALLTTACGSGGGTSANPDAAAGFPDAANVDSGHITDGPADSAVVPPGDAAAPPDVSIAPGPDDGLPAGFCPLPRFPDDAAWNQRVDGAALAPASDVLIAHLQAVGFGFGRFQVDFSPDVICANAAEPPQPFTPTGDFFSPDCDQAPVPLPAGGNIEGEAGYACLSDGDCHLLVNQPGLHRLYEMWRANVTNAGFDGGCLAVWDTAVAPPPEGRGQDCTSADAAGLPMSALLFDADEIAAGSIDHAIRFILPNDRIRHLAYVHPATHSTRAASGLDDSLPYGARLRLRANFDVASLPPAAQVVARALQTYGMILSDGGNIALTARSDRHTTHKWDALGFDSHALVAIHPQDFEVVDSGQVFNFAGNCVRTP